MLSDKQFFILLAIGAGGVWYLSQQSSKVNPNSPDNLAYQAANGITQTLAGRKLDKFGLPLTFGAWLAGG